MLPSFRPSSYVYCSRINRDLSSRKFSYYNYNVPWKCIFENSNGAIAVFAIDPATAPAASDVTILKWRGIYKWQQNKMLIVNFRVSVCISVVEVIWMILWSQKSNWGIELTILGTWPWPKPTSMPISFTLICPPIWLYNSPIWPGQQRLWSYIDSYQYNYALCTPWVQHAHNNSKLLFCINLVISYKCRNLCMLQQHKLAVVINFIPNMAWSRDQFCCHLHDKSIHKLFGEGNSVHWYTQLRKLRALH